MLVSQHSEGRNERDPKLAAISGLRRRRLQATCRRRRGQDACAPSRAFAAISSTRRSPLHHGRIVKRTGDGSIIEFRSVVDAVRCAIEIQNGLIERNAGVPEDWRIEFRVGIHRRRRRRGERRRPHGRRRQYRRATRGHREARRDLSFRGRLSAGERRLDLEVTDLGPTQLKNIDEPIRAYLLQVGAEPDETRSVARRQKKTLVGARVARRRARVSHGR